MIIFHPSLYLRSRHPHVDPMQLMGFIPGFLSEDDPRPAQEQIDENYAHGGGWMEFSDAFTMDDRRRLISKYPEDKPLEALAYAHLRDETIYYYDHSWVAIVQPDSSFCVARID
jgi:hypothetical protein